MPLGGRLVVPPASRSCSDVLMNSANPTGRILSALANRTALAAACMLSILGLGLALPERASSETGLAAIREPVFSLALVVFVASAASGLGLRALRTWIGPGSMDAMRLCLAAGLGSGILSYSLLALGIIGQLGTPQIVGVLILATMISLSDVVRIYSWIAAALRSAPAKLRASPVLARCIVVIGLFMAVGVLLRALAPPTGYDGLMYHILGPKLYLEEGRIFPSATMWMMNMPFNTEMLFTIGLVFGAGPFPNLVQMGFSLLFVAASMGLARQLTGQAGAWFGLATLLSMPILGITSSMANVDFSWAAFEILAVYAASTWKSQGTRPWLLLAGVFAGLGLGSKYLAIPGTAALALFIAWNSRSRGWQHIARTSALFAATAALVGSPWYLKNWLWQADPLFPFLGGGGRIDPARMSVLLAHIKTYGGIQSVTDWLTLPIRLYLEPSRFSEIAPLVSQPSTLFLFLLAYPLAKRSDTVTELLVMTAIRVTLMSAGAVVTRHLFPSFAILSLATAEVLKAPLGSRQLALPTRRVIEWIVGLSLAISMIIQVRVVVIGRPLPVVLGRESKAEYLQRAIPTYSAWAFAANDLPAGSTVLSTGDGRLSICLPACLPTDDQFLWARLVEASSSAEIFQRTLTARGITHVLVSQPDLAFFRTHDPNGLVARAEERLQTYLGRCGNELYRDGASAIFELDCLDG